MDAEVICERIAVMRRQEETIYRCFDYLTIGSNQASSPANLHAQQNTEVQQASDRSIDAECRRKMTEWCCQVVDFCKFSRETVGVAMTFLDRFLCTEFPRALSARNCRREFQLASMTSLYTAVKIHEPLEMDTELVSELSRGCYSAEEVAEMECDMLIALGWRMSGPTALGFVRHFLALLPPSVAEQPELADTILDFSRFQTELAVGDYYFVTKNMSTVALSSILNSIEAVILDATGKTEFLHSISEASGIAIDSVEIKEVKSRLMKSFVKSSGYDLKQLACHLATSSLGRTDGNKRCSMNVETSPVCVSTPPRSTFASH